MTISCTGRTDPARSASIFNMPNGPGGQLRGLRGGLSYLHRPQADNCILHFYTWLGDIARQIAAGAAISTDMASPGQLELLAGAVL